MADQKELTVAHRLVGDFAPKLAQLTDDVLFGDDWERAELSLRDHSLVTVAALIANGNTEQLTGHLRRAQQIGLSAASLLTCPSGMSQPSTTPPAATRPQACR